MKTCRTCQGELDEGIDGYKRIRTNDGTIFITCPHCSDVQPEY